jgi:hypothetical protein
MVSQRIEAASVPNRATGLTDSLHASWLWVFESNTRVKIGQQINPNSCYAFLRMRGHLDPGGRQLLEENLLGPSIPARQVWAKLLIVLLLFGVAGLSTVAKDSLYKFHSPSAQHVSSSTKMQTAHQTAVELEPAMPVLATLPASPKYRRSQVNSISVSFVPSVGVIVSLQHRSPPSLVS